MAKDVTFTGAGDGTRRVILDGREFPVGVEVKNVSEQNVKRLKALPGHEFRITDSSPDDHK